jgi:hypothetical protein
VIVDLQWPVPMIDKLTVVAAVALAIYCGFYLFSFAGAEHQERVEWCQARGFIAAQDGRAGMFCEDGRGLPFRPHAYSIETLASRTAATRPPMSE